MTILKSDIEVSNVNSLNGFFPVRTSSTDEAFDWDVAQGLVIRNLYNKTLAKNMIIKDESDVSYANFKNVCRRDFLDRLDEAELWSYLEDMYFSTDTFYKIAPECLLFKVSTLSASSPKNRLGDLFSSLMQDYYNKSPERIRRNFLEQQVVDSLRSNEVLIDFDGTRYSKGIEERPFLPFLNNYFCKDIELLSNHPAYLIENLEELLKLYAYLYTAQLALNINGFPKEPVSRPLYFIMENEIASVERSDLVRNGHQRVSKNIELIFPYLTMTETLQDVEINGGRIPLWDLASKLTTEDTASLKKYTNDFAIQRKLDFNFDSSECDPTYWLKALLELSLKQFAKGETRAAAQGKFIKSTEVELCSTFVRSRGRVGKVLVMNQDYLSLLTNLAVGTKERLRFHELLDEFKARGVYFDKKTQQSLIKFYERVGNVERMSDSGDAVYVRRTI
jgi:DNA phosphorothioation-dependent restriction protein DptG